MLFNGGDCSQSDNRQFLQFTCVDYGAGPPATEGSRSYIVVTDIKGNGIVYHRGWVEVGKNFFLRDPTGARWAADMFVAIYSSEETVPANLQQFVQFHSSCSSNLELKNRFGSVQLIEYVNELQGNVTCFAAATFDLDIVIPVEIAGESARMESLTALTNFAGFLDLTDQVAGQIIPAGGSLPVTLSAELDLTVRRRYTILTQVTARALPSNQLCAGTDFNSFFAGNPVPSNTPTPAPTREPTISPAPTANAITTACAVTAEVVCEVLNGEGRVVGLCEDARDPRNIFCGDNLPASGVGFKYRQGDGNPETVLVQVYGRGNLVFDKVISHDDIFYAEGDFRGGARIVIFHVDSEGVAGEEIESMTINTGCATGDQSLKLTEHFGPFELISFRNALGLFESVRNIHVQYFVENSGEVTMFAENALVSSGLTDGTDALPALQDSTVIGRNTRVLVYEETHLVDFGRKFSSGETYVFTMDAAGRGEVSGLECFSDPTYSF